MAAKKSSKVVTKSKKTTQKVAQPAKTDVLLAFWNKYNRALVLLVVVIIIGAFGVLKSDPNQVVKCSTGACFTEQFKKCAPATFDASVESVGSMNFEINSGDSTGYGCKMTVKYTKNINTDWENKPLTCVFDNTKAPQDALSEVFQELITDKNTHNCTGPLVAILNS